MRIFHKNILNEELFWQAVHNECILESFVQLLMPMFDCGSCTIKKRQQCVFMYSGEIKNNKCMYTPTNPREKTITWNFFPNSL